MLRWNRHVCYSKVSAVLLDISEYYYISGELTVPHYGDVKMDTMASLTNVYLNVYSGADQRKPQSSVSLAFVRGIHRGPGNSPHKWPVTPKMFPFDDVIMKNPIPIKMNIEID